MTAPEPSPTPPPPPEPEPPSPLASALSVLTTLGPPLTILSALLIYFGWARSDQQARAMGLDVSQFGFTAQDYVMRSISTLYVPLLAISVLAFGWLVGHARLVRALAVTGRRRAFRIGARIACGVGVAAAGTAVLTAALGADGSLLVPMVLAAGVALARYGGWLAAAAAAPPIPAQAPAWQRALRSLLVGVLITLALFWELSMFAGLVGRGYAQQIADTIGSLPRATAFSATPLRIEAPGVTEQQLPAPAGSPPDGTRYRTTGLRLLVVSGGRLFLLHDGWTPRLGTVIVLPDDPAVRWQFSQ